MCVCLKLNDLLTSERVIKSVYSIHVTLLFVAVVEL